MNSHDYSIINDFEFYVVNILKSTSQGQHLGG